LDRGADDSPRWPRLPSESLSRASFAPSVRTGVGHFPCKEGSHREAAATIMSRPPAASAPSPPSIGPPLLPAPRDGHPDVLEIVPAKAKGTCGQDRRVLPLFHGPLPRSLDTASPSW
jgi:hypothetical protein